MAQKRRPGRDPEEKESIKKTHAKVVEVEVMEPVETVNQNEKPKEDIVEAKAEDATQESREGSQTEAETKKQKIEINFPGSEIIRSKFPKSFNLAETVATDWIQDGNFEELEVGIPVANEALKSGLKKAKEVEKKIMASPITEKVTMQAFTYAVKAQGLVNELRAKIKKDK